MEQEKYRRPHFLVHPDPLCKKRGLFRQDAWKAFGANASFAGLKRPPDFEDPDMLAEWQNAFAAEALLRMQDRSDIPYECVSKSALPCGKSGPTYGLALRAPVAAAIFPLAAETDNGFECRPYVGRVWCFDLTSQDPGDWPGEIVPDIDDGWAYFIEEIGSNRDMRFYFEFPQAAVSGCSWQLAAKLAAEIVVQPGETTALRLSLAGSFIITGQVKDGRICHVIWGNKDSLSIPGRQWLYPGDSANQAGNGLNGYPVVSLEEALSCVRKRGEYRIKKQNNSAGKQTCQSLYIDEGGRKAPAADLPRNTAQRADIKKESTAMEKVETIMTEKLNKFIAELTRCEPDEACARLTTFKGTDLAKIAFMVSKERGIFIQFVLDGKLVTYTPASQFNIDTKDIENCILQQFKQIQSQISQGKYGVQYADIWLQDMSEDPAELYDTMGYCMSGDIKNRLLNALKMNLEWWLDFAREVRAETVGQGEWAIIFKEQSENEARSIFRMGSLTAKKADRTQLSETELNTITLLSKAPEKKTGKVKNK